MSAKLDIIIPHHREPWETGKKLFDMLELQRGIEKSDFRVIFVEDGAEDRINFMAMNLYSFDIVVAVNTDGQGVSAARNTGIDTAAAPWVTFVDFDDMYTSVFSLKVALEAIERAEKAGKVYLWNGFTEEGYTTDGRYALHRHEWDMTFIHGRFYKRQFLEDNELRFNEDLHFGEDQDFNTICQIIAGPERIDEIREPIFLWCTNENSVTRRVKDKSEFYADMLKHRFATLEELEARGIEGEHTAGVIRITADSFYEMNADVTPKNISDCEPAFAAWWKKNRMTFMTAPKGLIGQIVNTVRQSAIEKGMIEYEKITLEQWLRYLDEKYPDE